MSAIARSSIDANVASDVPHMCCGLHWALEVKARGLQWLGRRLGQQHEEKEQIQHAQILTTTTRMALNFPKGIPKDTFSQASCNSLAQ